MDNEISKIQIKEDNTDNIDNTDNTDKLLSITNSFNSLSISSSSDILLPKKLNFSEIRKDRQKENVNNVLNALINKNINKLKENSNLKELDRYLCDTKIILDLTLDTTFDKILNKCESDKLYAYTLAKLIAKNATRQGCKDEDLQIDTCAKLAAKLDIKIENLPNNKYRVSKLSSKIYTNNDVKIGIIDKSQCLKSFDGRITSSKVNGWIFSKVCFGDGGHQDNVFREEFEFCEWVLKYGNLDELYVVLIDSDKPNKLQSFARPNLFIGNHFEFQKYLISKFIN
jgi:hypothetical protein